MSKPQGKRSKGNSSPSTGLNFIYKSYYFLCQCVDILMKLDHNKVLNGFEEMQISDLQNIKERNMRIKKLFHIDLKHNHIYWQILKKSKRVIIKESLQNRLTLYRWDFNPNMLGSEQVIQVLGKWRYLKLKNFALYNEEAFKIINFNVVNNSFVNFEEFYDNVINLINVKLIEAYDGRILKNFILSMKSVDIHEKFWEFVSIQITRIWKKFEVQLQIEKIKQVHTEVKNLFIRQTLYKDLSRLYDTNAQFKCEQGQTSIPKTQKLTRQLSFVENCYKNQHQIQSSNFKNEINFYPLETDLIFDPQQSSSTADIIDSSFYKYPHPENYPFITDYEDEITFIRQNQDTCRKSMKRPANACHEYCVCLNEGGLNCPNLDRKIQCEHHDCINSRIRQKKGLLCWYLDPKKQDYQAEVLKQKLSAGFQVREFHSFGLDFHTVTLLYYLLPFNRISEGEIIDNQKEKKEIIQILIPYEVSKTQDLYLAVKKITTERQYERYRYEAIILQKKLKWIRQIEYANKTKKLGHKTQFFLKVQEPKCFYKGLGVINSGLRIPKNTFIGEFIGEAMPRYRIQQKQQICAKLIKMKNSIKFYCIDVFTHLDEQSQPRYFSIDPQNKGNFCRNLNHSCDPNCKVDVIVSQGKYILGIFTIREIEENEELTFDYMSVTDDYSEYIKSVCLCSSLTCRGRYFRYQDEIYTDLDGIFLEREEPIRKRIKSLICSCQASQDWSYLQSSRIQHLEKKKVNLKFVPKETKQWFFNWIESTEQIIANELQYLQNKNINLIDTQLHYSACEKSIIIDPKFGEKEKIATLNAKIEKISHYLNQINDFSPPFSSVLHQQLIKKLQHVVSRSKINLGKKISVKESYWNLSTSQKKIWDLRFTLFDIAQFQLKINKDLKKAFQYFQKAFTFFQVQTHQYPDYKSGKIKIWRENNSKYEGTVKCEGKDLYILENLILWAGELKKIKKSRSKINNQSKGISKCENPKKIQNLQEEIDSDFKRFFLKNEILMSIFQLQEERFRLKLPKQIKQKSLFSFQIDVQKLRKTLEKWVEKELSIFKYKKDKSKEVKRQTKVEHPVKIQYDKSDDKRSQQSVSINPEKRPKSSKKGKRQEIKLQA